MSKGLSDAIEIVENKIKSHDKELFICLKAIKEHCEVSDIMTVNFIALFQSLERMRYLTNKLEQCYEIQNLLTSKRVRNDY